MPNANNFIKELFFPRRCFFCKQYGCLLCSDCLALIDISPIHQRDHSKKYLSDIYAACSYENKRVKNLIHAFKYAPFNKELAIPLVQMIIGHFAMSESNIDFNNFIIIAAPLTKKRQRWRGFNQSEIIAKELARVWQIPIIADCLIKIKETKTQAELSQTQRLQNVKNAFACADNTLIKNKSVFLVDDVITTGATIQECAKILSQNGAKEVIAIAIARTDN